MLLCQLLRKTIVNSHKKANLLSVNGRWCLGEKQAELKNEEVAEIPKMFSRGLQNILKDFEN